MGGSIPLIINTMLFLQSERDDISTSAKLYRKSKAERLS